MTIQQASLRHGAISYPPSRSVIALLEWPVNGFEGGKFFPATSGELSDPYAPEDVRNAAPPPDGRIASAGHAFASRLDEPGDRWQKHQVIAGGELNMTWSYTAPHKTRRWNYFITKPNWDPNQRLTRSQFAAEPIKTVLNSGRPYWEHDLVPPQPTVHSVKVPLTHAGYHVLLGVWEVADTGMAFYQVLDLNIIHPTNR
ncbi:lytic polysaccharide monooxygenase auxiliary activity family 9 protein [Sorangium sp. So ce388]|uniref:lytic polysaccharide monooxygenase auxiliary activity family 9 protein n=1 Tax=Sorangium sp. So ce388 TaxID=3133309 RepID=UPI003F5BAB94